MRFAVNSCLLQFSVIHHITYTNVRGGSIVFEMKSGGKVGVFRADVRVNRCNFELSQGEMPKKSLYKPCAGAFNRSRATQAVAPDISKAFDSLACRSSSQTKVLWNFRSDVWPYFFFSQ